MLTDLAESMYQLYPRNLTQTQVFRSSCHLKRRGQKQWQHLAKRDLLLEPVPRSPNTYYEGQVPKASADYFFSKESTLCLTFEFCILTWPKVPVSRKDWIEIVNHSDNQRNPIDCGEQLRKCCVVNQTISTYQTQHLVSNLSWKQKGGYEKSCLVQTRRIFLDKSPLFHTRNRCLRCIQPASNLDTEAGAVCPKKN